MNSKSVFRWALGSLLLVCLMVSPLGAQTSDIEGAWGAQTYIMKDGAEHRVEGRIFFTESDWQVLFFTLDDEGGVVRAAGEGGVYTLEGDNINLRHLHNLSVGEAIEGRGEAPLRMTYSSLEDAAEEPSNVYVDGDQLTLAFPSGNRLVFTRSSR